MKKSLNIYVLSSLHSFCFNDIILNEMFCRYQKICHYISVVFYLLNLVLISWYLDLCLDINNLDIVKHLMPDVVYFIKKLDQIE